MPDYVRTHIPGGTYFITIVTHLRTRWLDTPRAFSALKSATRATQTKWPFTIHAWVVLPDHLHCLITLPEEDGDTSTRVRRFKSLVTNECKDWVEALLPTESPFGPVWSERRFRKNQAHVWQQRFWEHAIRDAEDFNAHIHYIKWNPVKHGLRMNPEEWLYVYAGQGTVRSDRT